MAAPAPASPAHNLASLLVDSARRFPALPAVAVGSAVRHDYAALAARVTRVAGAFSAAGLTAGRALTSHPSVAAELAESRYREDAVVRDGSLITSRGAGTAMAFALTLVETLLDRATADRLRAQMVVTGSSN